MGKVQTKWTLALIQMNEAMSAGMPMGTLVGMIQMIQTLYLIQTVWALYQTQMIETLSLYVLLLCVMVWQVKLVFIDVLTLCAILE